MRNEYYKVNHCVKSVRIQSFSGPYFPVFFGIQSEYGKIRIRKTQNTNTFHAVKMFSDAREYWKSYTKTSLGEGNLIFCCTDNRENYFGSVGRQNINNNLTFQGRHI